MSAAIRAKGNRLVLQVALASLKTADCHFPLYSRSLSHFLDSKFLDVYLIANGTVEWVIHEQELHHSFARLQHTGLAS